LVKDGGLFIGVRGEREIELQPPRIKPHQGAVDSHPATRGWCRAEQKSPRYPFNQKITPAPSTALAEESMRVAAVFLCTVFLTPAAVLAAGSFPPHRGDSPWSFTIIGEPSDTFVVNDTDSPSIDRFLFRAQGPISIQVPIRRYVGPTDAAGHLLNVSDLVSRGIVSATATACRPSTWIRNHSPSWTATATASTTSC
jgi:hypothetical protein